MALEQLAMIDFLKMLTEIQPERGIAKRRRQYHAAKERLLPLLRPENRTAGNRALVDWFRL